MKENWTYKKLGDVCQVVTGSTPKTNIPEYWSGKYPWITPAELKGDTYIRDTERHITDKAVAHTNLTLMPIGTVLLSSRAPIGKVAITETEMYCNQGFKNLICSDEINNKYLFLWLKGQTDYLNSLGRGATFKEISKNIVENIQIPLPPLSIQQSIVAELDEINNLLQLKKKELETFDKLAQSVFYEMFGDPVTNEKGWDVKKLGEIGTCVAGATPSTTVDNYWTNGTISWLSSGEVSKGRIYETDKKISQMGYDSCSTKMIPAHTILIAMAGQGKTRGTVGVAEIPLCTNQSICSILTNEQIDVDFLYYQIKYLYNELRSASNGDGGRGGLSLKLIQKFSIITPSLSLQKTFSDRITAIEQQKEQVKASINKLETLLASRMQYWFD